MRRPAPAAAAHACCSSAHGGNVAGARLTQREQCRRMLSSIWWISSQLAAFMHMGMLIAQLNDACSRSSTPSPSSSCNVLRRPRAPVVHVPPHAAFAGQFGDRRAFGDSLSGRSCCWHRREHHLLAHRRHRPSRPCRHSALGARSASGGDALKTGSAADRPRQLTGSGGTSTWSRGLVYIRPRLIAMSVPSTGLTALYRNPLSRFLASSSLATARRFAAPKCRIRRAHSGASARAADPSAGDGLVMISLAPMPHALLSAVSRLSHRSSTALPLFHHPLPLRPSLLRPSLLRPSLCSHGTACAQIGSVVCYDVQDHTPPWPSSSTSTAPRGHTCWRPAGRGKVVRARCATWLLTRRCAKTPTMRSLFALERTELDSTEEAQGVDTPSRAVMSTRWRDGEWRRTSPGPIWSRRSPRRFVPAGWRCRRRCAPGAGGEGGVPDGGSAPLHAVDAAGRAANGSGSGRLRPYWSSCPLARRSR